VLAAEKATDSAILKMDQSLVRELEEDSRDSTIVRAILAMARALDLSVTAEGLETLHQVEYLVDIGCELLKDYHFIKSVPLDEFKDYCRDRQKLQMAGS
jgi:EAL domain-containing protein (putative c-di-GMP-specific phosphodiesterase class I)